MKKDNRYQHNPSDEFNHSPEEMPTMFLLHDVSKLFHDNLRGYNEKMGIQDGFRLILFMLAKEDGITQYEISKLIHIKAPTVSVALQKMESEGLVRRVTDENDMRQSRVYITEKGKSFNDMCRMNLVKAEEEIRNTLTPEEETALRSILMKMRIQLIEKRQNDRVKD